MVHNHLETYEFVTSPCHPLRDFSSFIAWIHANQSIPHNIKLYIKYPNENPWIYASRSYGGYELTTSTNNVPVPMKNRPSSSASHVKWLYLGAEMPYCQSSLIVHKQIIYCWLCLFPIHSKKGLKCPSKPSQTNPKNAKLVYKSSNNYGLWYV